MNDGEPAEQLQQEETSSSRMTIDTIMFLIWTLPDLTLHSSVFCDTWPDEESYFTSKKKCGSNQSIISNSGQRRKTWTESKTQNLKKRVKKLGEGNWKQIRAYYSCNDRTNVNLKDRWRTMKNQNMV
uniref:Uncharacterized protein n=1 Tax=Amphiprion percula TaxID=161767 RepID=A0A3P8SGU1_AMPPE